MGGVCLKVRLVYCCATGVKEERSLRSVSLNDSVRPCVTISYGRADRRGHILQRLKPVSDV